jgi:hypothetical protein
MSLMTWMMEKGSLGGIARSVSKVFNKSVREEPNAPLSTHLANVALFRYLSVNNPFNTGLSLRLVYNGCIDNGVSAGLLSLCVAFASVEMDYVDDDVKAVLQKVLRKEGFSYAEILGTADPEQFTEQYLEIMNMG